jgi:dTDP-4-amino-4,6-dideoxygalactose transaminase
MSGKLIKLSKSCISNAEKHAVMGVLDREYLGMGEEVQQFEDALSEFFSRPVVCAINGTAALHLSMQACGVSSGDEVLLPALTYIASFQAISATGAKPVACDINEKTCLLDLADAEKRITENTKAMMPVHYTGCAGDLDALYEFANKYNLRIVEDAAHAFGTTYKNKRIGSFGDIACFSFDGIKNITSGEGGCIVTDDEEILQNIRDARLLGVEKDTEKRYSGERSWDFDVTGQGWRYHMSNIMAAIGLEQLKRFSGFAENRQKIALKYDQLFSDQLSIKFLPRDYNTVVPHIYVVRVTGKNNRKEIQQKMLEKGIQVGYHYQPNHWLDFYKDYKALPLPITDSIFPEMMSLPLHPDLSISEVEFVAENLILILKNKI